MFCFSCSLAVVCLYQETISCFVSVLLLLWCVLSMITSEARRDRKRTGKGRKRAGKSGRTRHMNKFYACPLSCENTKRKPCFDSEPREMTVVSITRGDVQNSLNSTRALLDDLLISLDVVKSKMVGLMISLCPSVSDFLSPPSPLLSAHLSVCLSRSTYRCLSVSLSTSLYL